MGAACTTVTCVQNEIERQIVAKRTYFELRTVVHGVVQVHDLARHVHVARQQPLWRGVRAEGFEIALPVHMDPGACAKHLHILIGPNGSVADVHTARQQPLQRRVCAKNLKGVPPVLVDVDACALGNAKCMCCTSCRRQRFTGLGSWSPVSWCASTGS